MRGGSTHGRRGRGQSTLDFTIGVSVFLIAVTFTFAFVPGLTQPFADTARVTPATADRVADRLASDDLARPDRPYLLDATCTAAFFDSTRDDAGCAFDNGRPIPDRLGLPKPTTATSPNVRVGLYDSGGEPLCWDDEGGTAVPESDPDCDGDDPTLVGGGPLTDSGGVVVARRAVVVGGTDALLRVSVW
ncbi:DUF7287 family protein [Halomarina pelagica]|uniref:DUF7287 family protein n=1 Tax=Halomarina pelagica TaxID=2961599 RepID=UPI0020C35117|nr:hypothetical protein [Halomarina sp. BND7]